MHLWSPYVFVIVCNFFDKLKEHKGKELLTTTGDASKKQEDTHARGLSMDELRVHTDVCMYVYTYNYVMHIDNSYIYLPYKHRKINHYQVDLKYSTVWKWC